MANCGVCSGQLDQVLDFGRQPLANGFLDESQFQDEYFYDLKVGWCHSCRLAQLIDPPAKELMFNEDYPFSTASSDRMKQHFSNLAALLKNNYLPHIDDTFVVEIGCNDGTFLSALQSMGTKVLGVDPVGPNQALLDRNISVIKDFFNKEISREIVENYGKANAIVAANTICHIQDLHELMYGVEILLADDGFFIFEEPYLPFILNTNAFEQFYDEHAYYFSVSAIKALVEYHKMYLINVEFVDTHGGSLRYIVAKKPFYFSSLRDKFLANEIFNLNQDALVWFNRRVNANINCLTDLVVSMCQRFSIVGYGATSKSTTLLNYAPDIAGCLEYISDTSPRKIGKFSPGVHIPILPYEYYQADAPGYSLLFAWNHRDEIMVKEKEPRFICYVPGVHFDSGF